MNLIHTLKESELYHGRLVQCNEAFRGVYPCIYKIIIDNDVAYYVGCTNNISIEPIHSVDDLTFKEESRIKSPGDVWLETSLTAELNRDKKLNELIK